MEKLEGSKWLLIAGGAGAAFATVALLIDFEQKRQRRFVAGDSCSQRCSLCIAFMRSNLEVTLVYASGRESSQDTPDMKTIKNAISEAAGVKAKAVTGAGNEDKSSLEELLPKTFFATSAPEDSRKHKGVCVSLYTRMGETLHCPLSGMQFEMHACTLVLVTSLPLDDVNADALVAPLHSPQA